MTDTEKLMKELKKLPNVDETLYVEERYNEVFLYSEKEQYSLGHNKLNRLIHSVRAFALTGLEGNAENLKKGLSVFDMLMSMRAYHPCCTAEKLASHRYFTEKLYDIGFENVKVMAQYLLDHVAKVKTDVYTDGEGCSYNSLYLTEV